MIALMIRRLARSILGLLLFVTALFASDIDGIWAGQQQGRAGGMEDVAFRFKLEGQSLKGVLFGDEFDLPVSEASLSANQLRFVITTVNYYSGARIVYVYTGMVKDGEMELLRERVQTPEDIAAKRPPTKQTLKLKRIQ